MVSFSPVSAAPVSTQEGPGKLSASGALQAANSTLTASAEVILAANGSLAAQNATATGTGDVFVDATGALSALNASITGNADLIASASGVLAVETATVDGQTKAIASADGALTAQNATLAGRVVFIRLSEIGVNSIFLDYAGGNTLTVANDGINSVEVADMQTFTIKQGDTSPQLKVTLKNPDGTGVDLSSINGVAFSMRDQQGTTKINAASATVVTAADGVVKYDWQVGDTDTPGTFYAEWEVTFGSGAVETFPNDGYQPIQITPQIQ